MKNSYVVVLAGLMLVFGLVAGRLSMDDQHSMGMEEKRVLLGSLIEDVRGQHLKNGDFACCLESPCTYCLKYEKGCDCLEEVMNGEHPCGECIGEILEGHGNRFLGKYFAASIAEKVGEAHLEELKEIISEKYGIAVDEQGTLLYENLPEQSSA